MTTTQVPSVKTLQDRIAADSAAADAYRKLAEFARSLNNEMTNDEARRCDAIAVEYDVEVADQYDTLAENYTPEEAGMA